MLNALSVMNVSKMSWVSVADDYTGCMHDCGLKGCHRRQGLNQPPPPTHTHSLDVPHCTSGRVGSGWSASLRRQAGRPLHVLLYLSATACV